MSDVRAASRRFRRVAAWSLVVVACVAAVLGVVHAGSSHPPRTQQQRVTAVASTLRCPACAGESVAASQSPVAAAMRAEIRDQVRNGRSDDQVRRWFVARYGPDVSVMPGARGPDALLWVVPAAVLLIGLLLLFRRPGPRSPQPAVRPVRLLPGRSRRVAGAVLGVVATVAVVGGAAAATGRLPGTGTSGAARTAATSTAPSSVSWADIARGDERAGDYAEAATAYRKAIAAEPAGQQAALRVRLALVLLRLHRPAAAEQQARTVLADDADQADALLVLGLAQRARSQPAADATLRRFLQVAPQHAAAAEVRRLLAAG